MTVETIGILRDIQSQLTELRSDFITLNLKLIELTAEVDRNKPQPLRLIKTDLIAPDLACFTERELDLVNLLKTGLANKCIAHELGISESTVKVHVKSILRKLKAKNRTEVACMMTKIA